MEYQRDGNFRDIFLPKAHESRFASSTIKVVITAKFCVVALFEESADVRVCIACRRMLGCAGGGSSLGVPELPSKLTIPIGQSEVVDGVNCRAPGRLLPLYYMVMHFLGCKRR